MNELSAALQAGSEQYEVCPDDTVGVVVPHIIYSQ